MSEKKRSINEWVVYLTQRDLPVLRQTAEELKKLRENEDKVTGKEISKVILHDSMLTIKVLRYLQGRKKNERSSEITTISHAVMMMGLTNFFEHFSNLTTIEDTLADNPVALKGMLSAVSRGRHAALYAQDWSILRRDIESDEVTIAALLHDMTEMLLWCYSPSDALEIKRIMMRDSSVRSMEAQKKVLGFDLPRLQILLAAVWHLPELLRLLMDTNHAKHPRVMTVTLATALARHSQLGWYNAALPDDYAAVQDFLKISPEELHENINYLTLSAARSWKWYNVPPSAAWLPMLPGDWPVE